MHRSAELAWSSEGDRAARAWTSDDAGGAYCNMTNATHHKNGSGKHRCPTIRADGGEVDPDLMLALSSIRRQLAIRVLDDVLDADEEMRLDVLAERVAERDDENACRTRVALYHGDLITLEQTNITAIDYTWPETVTRGQRFDEVVEIMDDLAREADE